MHPAAKLQFERVVIEFARWQALTEDDRPPAPAWWWGPAVEVRDVALELPARWSSRLGLPMARLMPMAQVSCSILWPARSFSRGPMIFRAR